MHFFTIKNLMVMLLVVQLTACDSEESSDSSDTVQTVDADGDGLIDIYTLEQLDWIRNDLAGTSLTDNDLISDSSGCPSTGCNGYELMANLDFDTNGDGVMDENDTYFDYDGDESYSGWLPIGDADDPFNASFEGNGFTINNLYIDRESDDTETAGKRIGLFGYISIAEDQSLTMSNIHLEGTLMSIVGDQFVAGLIGRLTNHGEYRVSGNYITGEVSGYDDSIAGLLGYSANYGTIILSDNTVSGDLLTAYGSGGLVGQIFTYELGVLSVSHNLITADLVGKALTGGLIGYVNSEDGQVTITNNISTGNVSGTYLVAGLIGQNSAFKSSIHTVSNNIVTGNVSATGFSAGGLMGYAGTFNAASLTITNNISSGDVSGGTGSTGGMIGSTGNSSSMSISDNLISSSVSGDSTTELGAFIGSTQYGSAALTYSNNYFNNSETGVTALPVVGEGDGNGIDPGEEVAGFTLTDLQCPVTSDDDSCVSGSLLFDGWSSSVWDFGTTTQLPGLIIGEFIYRDSDGDGNLTTTEIDE